VDKEKDCGFFFLLSLVCGEKDCVYAATLAAQKRRATRPRRAKTGPTKEAEEEGELWGEVGELLGELLGDLGELGELGKLGEALLFVEMPAKKNVKRGDCGDQWE